MSGSEHTDYILPGPRWKNQQQKEATASDSPMVWERISCKALLGDLKFMWNTLLYLPFSSPSHQSCTCLEQHSIFGFFSFLPQVVRALNQTSRWIVIRSQAAFWTVIDFVNICCASSLGRTVWGYTIWVFRGEFRQEKQQHSNTKQVSYWTGKAIHNAYNAWPINSPPHPPIHLYVVSLTLVVRKWTYTD